MPVPMAERRWVLLAAALLPPAAITLLVAAYAVNVPYWDTWSWLERHYGAEDSTPAALLARYWPLHNGHRVLVPLLFDRALLWASSNDMLPRIFLKLPFSLGSLALVLHLARRTAPGAPRAVLAGVLALLSFPLTYWPMWMDPRQFSIHIVVFCVLAAMVVATGNMGARFRFVACAALCAVASLSYAPGLLAWPVLGLVLWRRGPLRSAGALASWCLVTLAVVVPHVRDLVVGTAADAGLRDGLRTVLAACAVAGMPVAPARGPVGAVPAVVTGALGIAALLVLTAMAWRRAPDVRDRALPWVALGGWAAAYAVLAGWARGTQSLDALLDPRFAYLAAQLWVALAALVSVLAFDGDLRPQQAARWRRAYWELGVVLVASYATASLWPLHAPGGIGRLSTQLQTGRACLLEYESADDACLELLYPSAARVRDLTRTLQVKGAGFLIAEPPATPR
jgi:hypothetical protein